MGKIGSEKKRDKNAAERVQYLACENKNKNPIPEDFGWYSSEGFDGMTSSWALEGGEEEYYKALASWENKNRKLDK